MKIAWKLLSWASSLAVCVALFYPVSDKWGAAAFFAVYMFYFDWLADKETRK